MSILSRRTCLPAALLAAVTTVALAPSPTSAQDANKAEALEKRLGTLEQRMKALEDKLEEQVQKMAEEQAEATREHAKMLASFQDEVAVVREGLGDVMNRVAAVRLPTVEEDEPYWEVEVGGFVRLQDRIIFEDEEETDFVGRNDGFQLANARLEVDAAFGENAFDALDRTPVGRGIYARLSFEGAAARFEGANTPENELVTELRDAYFTIARRYVAFVFGQFKPPFDAESLQSTSEMVFIDRALESRGIVGVEGDNIDGLVPQRQAGAMLVAGYDAPANVGIRTYSALTNGNDAPFVRNDASAFYGRLEVKYDDLVTAGGAVKFVRRSTGLAPDLLDEEDLAWTADLNALAYDVFVSAAFITQSRQFPDVDAEIERTAMGWHAALGYRFWLFGFTPWEHLTLAYRFATLDPLSDDVETDEVRHHTLALDFPAHERFPVKVAVNYTIAEEDEGREIDNDRLDFLFGVDF